MKGISCILIATGRLDQLQASIASFLAQDHQPKQLVIVNLCFRQNLVFDHPEIQIFNSKTQIMQMRAKNDAIAHAAKYDTLVIWSELDYYLPNHLPRVAEAIEGKSWVWFGNEFQSPDRRTLKMAQGSESCFAFTRDAWERVGGFKAGINGADDRNFVARVTKMTQGEKVATSKSQITFIKVGGDEWRSQLRPNIRSGAIKLEPLLAKDFVTQVRDTVSGKREFRVCVVMLGRYGDLISILPMLKIIHDRYGKVWLCVAKEFSDLLEGVSYVNVHPLPIKNEELGHALSVCREMFDVVLCAGVWGKGWTQKKNTASYCSDAWNNMGMLQLFNDPTIKPEFDRRDELREAEFIAKVFGGTVPSKPIILVNVSHAISSPCPQCKPVLDDIKKMWEPDNVVVDLAQFRASKLFDLLGLFEISHCLVCIDSSYVHLAQATELPIVLIKNPKPWAGTIVRRNLAAETDYEKLDMRLIHEGVAAALQRPTTIQLTAY